jgi:hypothetical protein
MIVRIIGVMVMQENGKIAQWRSLYDEFQQDQAVINFYKKYDERRIIVRKEILDLWGRFSTGTLGLEEFRKILDLKTRTDWDVFGIKGMSGAMFLNKLVKYVPHEDLIPELIAALTLPPDGDSGYSQMRTFQAFLDDLIETGVTEKRYLQPARLSFLVSAFWHLQDTTEAWPIYYLSARKALETEGHYELTGDTTEDYFAFRSSYLELTRALNLPLWEFEHLCVWYTERDVKVEEPVNSAEVIEYQPEPPASTTIESDDKVSSSHLRIQLMLAKIGARFKYNVWIASNDRNKVVDGERLGDYSIPELPIFNGVGPKSQQMIELIDVLWLKGQKIIAAFEVESTTSIFSGLLRMSDLQLALQNIFFPIYIVVPEQRSKAVREQLSRLTFQQLGLHEICGYFTFEDLANEYEAIIRWATDYKAMEKLSRKVGAMSDEDY